MRRMCGELMSATPGESCAPGGTKDDIDHAGVHGGDEEEKLLMTLKLGSLIHTTMRITVYKLTVHR